MSLELRLLGEPAVLLDGQEVMLATRKALALLAYLALEGVTARGKLADALWSEMDEDASRSNLRKELFRLRETPLRDALISSQTKLELSADVVVDAKRFLELSASNDESALEWYGGALLEGIELSGATAFETWLEEKREVLLGARQRLLLNRASRLEAGGDWRGSLEARQLLLHADPLQESHHREVMRLHWRLGERGAALDAFDRLAHLLQRELGLTPLPETLELLSKVQRGAEEDGTPLVSSTSNLPNLSRPPLVGREAAWRWLEVREQGLSLIVGEVGVGKTRLAEDTLEPALTLRGFESASATPFYPIAEALRAALPRLRTLDDVWRLEVARLLPELLHSGELEAPSSSDGRARFLEALTRALLLLLEPEGMALLDDLHWFDTSSLEVVAHLIRRAPERRHVATARQLELTENAAAQTLLTSLERAGLLQRLELNPFTEAQTLSLLQSLSGGAARLFARRLQSATGGNALFTLETLRGLFQSGALQIETDGAWITPFDDATEDYTELPLPQNVLELALRRVTHLGGAVQRLLEVAALAGEPFEADELGGATALSEWERLEALERALSAQIVKLEGNAYRFSHDVLRRSLLNAQSLERQRLIHRRLADTLVKNRAAPSRIARHLELGARESEAAPWHVKAAEAAQSVYAHLEARGHYERALQLTRDELEAFRIHAALAELELTLLRLEAMDDHANAMLEISARANDANLETKARLTRAKVRLYKGQYKEALEEVQNILPRATRDALPEALTVLGTALIGCGQLGEAEPHLKRVLETASVRSPLIGEAHALLKEIYRQQGDLERALEQAGLAINAHRALRMKESELTIQAQAGQILGLLGQSERAIATLQGAVREAREMGFERVLTVALVLIAGEYLRNEEWIIAEETINEGLSLTTGKMLARECQFTGMLARVQRRTGRYEAARATAIIALKLSEQLGHLVQRAQIRFLLAEIQVDLRRFEEAQRYLQEMQDLMRQADSNAYEQHFQLLSAKISLEQGQIEKARMHLDQIGDGGILVQPGFKIMFLEMQTRLS
jgi:DNA-binding SARP family transcriptional activator/tetratricopeptide (TPR) repeat protein